MVSAPTEVQRYLRRLRRREQDRRYRRWRRATASRTAQVAVGWFAGVRGNGAWEPRLEW